MLAAFAGAAGEQVAPACFLFGKCSGSVLFRQRRGRREKAPASLAFAEGDENSCFLPSAGCAQASQPMAAFFGGLAVSCVGLSNQMRAQQRQGPTGPCLFPFQNPVTLMSVHTPTAWSSLPEAFPYCTHTRYAHSLPCQSRCPASKRRLCLPRVRCRR